MDIAIKELREVLKKHNISIGFNCSDCSDLHGIYDERMEIRSKGALLLKVRAWSIDHADLNGGK